MTMTEAPRQKSVLCLHPGGLHRMAYVEWGDPQNPSVVVCVHGLTRNGRDFDTLAEALSARHRVICPDIVGRGRSDRLTDWRGYGFPQYVGDCVTLLARLDVETVSWVGTSMGGLIGMMIAASDPSPIGRFVINDVGPRIARAGLQRIGAGVGTRTRFASVDEALDHFTTVSPGFGPHSPAEWRRLNAHMIVPDGDGFVLHYDPRIGDAARQDIAGPAEVDLWPIWDRVRCPTLILRGGDSDLFEADIAEAMTRRGPTSPPARCITYPGVGHAPTLVKPGQVHDVVAFLDGAA